ncbi:transglutaminase family protein [Reinekea marinisedimentorum]|uniref:Transglutaminase-like putative cysteine protease n=1 Tax=Reinekea marinisedimentorum TaxID=230495 RepID=A0A4V6NY52_9GAMM|nr:transglutaminase family protein [Reinekea marinisedimentorum]TCS43262.1 transglutaminase-like putative cysteine protease [Reinekea marinisedimentorum]
MKYRVRHLTEYQYAAPVTLCYNIAHLLPRNTDRQRIKSTRISVSPTPAYQRSRRDYFGNTSFYFSVQEPHEKLVIDVSSDIEVSRSNVVGALDTSPTCRDSIALLKRSERPEYIEIKEFQLSSPMIKKSKELADFGWPLFAADKPLLRAAMDLTTKIFDEFTFDPTSTTVATPLAEVIENKRGVCQDFAHFQVGVLRSLGFPARYVSGYIETLPPPGQERLVGADASHAWVSLFIPELGWVDFDPTNNSMPDDQHIITAWGRDYSDITPLQGVIFDGGDSQSLSVSVDVARRSEQ